MSFELSKIIKSIKGENNTSGGYNVPDLMKFVKIINLNYGTSYVIANKRSILEDSTRNIMIDKDKHNNYSGIITNTQGFVYDESELYIEKEQRKEKEQGKEKDILLSKSSDVPFSKLALKLSKLPSTKNIPSSIQIEKQTTESCPKIGMYGKDVSINKLFVHNGSKFTIKAYEFGGAGNCFYLSLSAIINKNINVKYSVNDLRKLVSKEILLMSDEEFDIHKFTLSESGNITKEEMAKKMLMASSWADSLSMYILGKLFKIKFLIYDKRINKFTCQGYIKDDFNILAVLYYTGSHYQVGIIFKDDKEILIPTLHQDITSDGIDFLTIIYSDKNKSYDCI